MEKQRLILLLDGTWNGPEDQTNVARLAAYIKPYDGYIHQRFYYGPGVGTRRSQRLRGGVLGYGLTDNLLAAYDWLSRRYHVGDEIWIFGFSRGAYTARSLAGMVRKCGLLRISTPGLLQAAEKLYRQTELHPEDHACKAFRNKYSQTTRIHFMGVWDTVGALGIPGTFVSEFGKYAWHDTRLSGIVDRAYHAMALDEHRAVYDVALWTSEDGSKKSSNIDVEQRWFIGAHANVGGGYAHSNQLPDIALQWMMTKAVQAGLKLKGFYSSDVAWQDNPNNSYTEFLAKGYQLWRSVKSLGNGRHYRSFAKGYRDAPAVNVTVDPSVWLRWQARDDYRPPTLVQAQQSPPEPVFYSVPAMFGAGTDGQEVGSPIEQAVAVPPQTDKDLSETP